MLFSRLLYFVSIISIASSIQLLIYPGEVRCIGEELVEKSSVKFSFKQVNNVADGNKDLPTKGLRMQISGPSIKQIYRNQLNGGEEKDFQYMVAKSGLHRVCFVSNLKTEQRVEINIKRLFDAENFVKSIKMEALQPLELLLSRAEDATRAINMEMDATIAREVELKVKSENMEWRINAFALFSIVVLISLSAWQTYFLKSYFRAKKLL
mmetsp:Transcript_12765/g.19096  ORF Transcript_12765/g.19096 Transcript_12765/m.19096 type:complete len:209 (+) Transcript_12765:31-657(+)|eukprot:CAMPEP_0171457698 /NCGR_PEP_ID=MMETSP0945-20130129/3673_1 /TAXON_ID=109269 /ORGANISM="Vaucheria litorea, Strain CCMP2940" /LENGTH=208 /DNA_ID=CAMNT_0011983359 /DNA_START=27 /DNA_END=653 /DNA_ORIENTATION=-